MAAAKVVIGGNQTRGPPDDPVPVMIGVAGECNLEAVLKAEQPLHRVRRRRCHADLAIPIRRHKTERRVDGPVDYRQVPTVELGNWRRRANRRPC